MLKKRIQLFAFSLVFFASYAGIAISTIMVTPYLKTLGYNDSQVGLVFSLSSLLGIFMQIFIGKMVEKKKRFREYSILLIVISIMSNAFLFRNEPSYCLILFYSTILFASTKTFFGLIDTWMLEEDTYVKEKYGMARAIGGLGFFTQHIMKEGFSIIEVLFSTFMIITLIFVFFIQDTDKSKHVIASSKKTPVKAMLNKGFILWNIVLFFVFFILNSEDMIINLKMIELGATEYQIGLRGSIQALLELPLFFLGFYIIKKYDIRKLFYFSAILLAAKGMYYFFINNITGILIGTFFHFFTYPIIILCSKHLISKTTPTAYKISGQMVSIAFYSSFSGILSPLVFGVISNQLHVNFALLLMSVLSITAFITAWYTGQKVSMNKLDNI